MATYKIPKKDINAPALQAGTDNLYFTKWKFKKANTKEFSWEWQYTHNGSIWFAGSSGTTAYSDGASAFTSTYSPPENAKSIRFRVKPVAKQITKKKKKVDAYKGKMSSWVTTSKVNVYPETPSAPTVELDGLWLTMYVDIYDKLAKKIQFEVVRTFENTTTVYNRGDANVVMNRATLRIEVASGGEYKVRCRAFNGNWASLEWSQYSSDTFTAPPKITGTILIQATTDNAVKITLPTPVDGAVQYAVQYTTNEDYFDSGGNVSSTTTDRIIGTTIYVPGLSTDAGEKYFFRIAAINKANQQAPWSDTFWIVLGTKPAAPTTWQSTSTAKIGENVIIYWLHNSQDSSKERSAILQMTIDGVKQADITITNNTWQEVGTEQRPSQYTINTSKYTKDTEIIWCVKTKGIADEYGPFSATRKINVYYPPTIALNIFKDKYWYWDPFDFELDDIYSCDGEYYNPYDLPVELIPHFPLYIGAEVFPKTVEPLEANMSIYSMQDYRTEDYTGEEIWIGEGQQIFSRNINYRKIGTIINEFHLALLPKDVNLEDGVTYRLVCTVIMKNGLVGTAEVIFTTDFDEPNYDVNAVIDYDPNLTCCYIQPYCEDPETDELVRDCTLSVYRRNFDGEFIEIGKNLRNREQVTVLDPHPTLRNVVYRIVSMSTKTGAILYYDLPPEPVDETAIVVQWNERWRDLADTGEYDEEAEPAWSGQVLRLPYDVDVSDSSDPDVNLVSYIGRKHPVSYYGTQVGQSHTLSSNIPWYDTETVAKLRALSVYMGNAYVREPSGVGYWAKVKVSFNINHCEMKIPITLDITRVEGGV